MFSVFFTLILSASDFCVVLITEILWQQQEWASTGSWMRMEFFIHTFQAIASVFVWRKHITVEVSWSPISGSKEAEPSLEVPEDDPNCLEPTNLKLSKFKLKTIFLKSFLISFRLDRMWRWQLHYGFWRQGIGNIIKFQFSWLWWWLFLSIEMILLVPAVTSCCWYLLRWLAQHSRFFSQWWPCRSWAATCGDLRGCPGWDRPGRLWWVQDPETGQDSPPSLGSNQIEGDMKSIE